MPYVLTNPHDERDVRFFLEKDDATQAAFKINRATDRHPSLLLFQTHGEGKMRYLGRLWRQFGRDFDPDNCWNPELPYS